VADGLPAAGLRAGAEPGRTGLVELKRSLANLVKQDIGQLTALVKTRLRQMQYRPGLLDGFLAKTGLDLQGLNCRGLRLSG
jgi:putative transposase